MGYARFLKNTTGSWEGMDTAERFARATEKVERNLDPNLVCNSDDVVRLYKWINEDDDRRHLHSDDKSHLENVSVAKVCAGLNWTPAQLDSWLKKSLELREKSYPSF